MSSESVAGPPKDLPRWIGGYRVIGELGRERLGPVVLARQSASGRDVALKVVKPEWVCLPKYVGRLVREAYAAAQLEHPNLVRLEEIGEAQGRVYFVTERIDGTSLADRVKGQGALPAREAIVHVLQAARALMHAHSHGLAHGDVKPERLYVTSDGVTKLADLGLVKTPEGVEEEERRESTGPIALGELPKTDPSPDAVRADVRALGKTLEALIVGRAADGPSDAASLIARGIPINLVELVAGLCDARPEGGFATPALAASALERFLASKKPGATPPREEHTRALTASVEAFRASPSAKLRSQLELGAVAFLGLLILFSLIGRRFFLAGSFLGLGVMTALAYFLLNGSRNRTDLFAKVRRLVAESRPGDKLIGLAGVVLLLTALWVLRLLGLWILFGLLAVAVAAALHFVLDRKVEAERRPAIDEANGLLRSLRLLGLSEDSLRRFVRATAGADWEPFFEALFGHASTLAAREPSERGIKGILRRKAVPWREWVEPRVDAGLEAIRRARETTLLEAIEERGGVAEGVNLLTARRRAWRTAEAMVAVSTEIRAASKAHALTSSPDLAERPSVARAVRLAAETPEQVLVEKERGLIGTDPSFVRELLFGPRTRFLLGAALLAGFLLWVRQNEVVSGEQLKDVAVKAIESPDHLEALRNARIDVRLDGATRPLELPFLPRPIARLFHGIGPGVGGLILLLSAFLSGSRVGYFAVSGAAIALFGPALGLPGIGPLDPAATSMALGAVVAGLGLFFGRSRED